MRRNLGRAARLAALFLSFGVASLTGTKSAEAQTVQYDGVYAGMQTLTEGGSVHNYSECLKGPFKRSLFVKNGAVTYLYNPTTNMEVIGTVSPAGDISASASTPAGGVSLSGKIQGDQFTGEIWSLYCTYSLELKRTP